MKFTSVFVALACALSALIARANVGRAAVVALAPIQQATPPPSAPPPAPPAEPQVYAPILMYHQIGGRPSRFNVSLADFAAQMRWLKANGYTPVSVDQIAAALRGAGQLPPKPVALTFDDGWRNQFVKAKPVLDELGFKATFYIISGSIGHPPTYMTWDELKQLQAEGHWIAAHSVTHRPSSRLSAAELHAEMAGSRDAIAQHLGQPATTYAYPYGSQNAFVQDTAKQLGFAAAVGVVGLWKQKPGELFNLHRIEVSGWSGVSGMVGWLTGRPTRVLPPASAFLSTKPATPSAPEHHSRPPPDEP